jgi:uncharacterized protein (TIGR03118 family)
MVRLAATPGLMLAALTITPLAVTAPQEPAGAQTQRISVSHTGERTASYEAQILVSDGSTPADFTDPNLINGWGVAFNPNGFAWVVAEGTGKATLYDGRGRAQSPVVTIPPANGQEHGTPTGIVFSTSDDFVVKQGDASGPARFIVATTGGTIAGWSANVNPTEAIVAVDRSGDEAAYTGLALSGNGMTHVLYAADFRHRRVDMFDAQFKPIEAAGAFVDEGLPEGYSPFGIQAVGGDIYVTYARQEEEDPEEEEKGPGLGVVDVFDPNGAFLRRVATKGPLNAPWGVALAPASFGPLGGAVLIGNLGDGTIHAFSPRTGAPLGALNDSSDRPISVDGLWGIAFGNGIQAQNTNELFFAAGPQDETHGTYGVIRVRR